MVGGTLIIFGLIQGLTEFVPISSSGHLAIVGQFLGETENQLVSSVLVNIGTWLALIWATRPTLLALIGQAGFGRWRLLAKLVVATLPAVVVGWLAVDWLVGLNEQPLVFIIMLTGVGLLMLLTPKPTQVAQSTTLSDLDQQVSWLGALGIGSMQAVALIPGTSRSGVTILGGLMARLSPATAASWSFLMAVPVTFGAILRVLVFNGGSHQLIEHWPWFLVANLVSLVVGLLSIRWLLSILSRWSLRPFGWYRLVLGLVLVFLLAIGLY